jgi:SPP1 family predicted phage head-tail adaptor
MIITKLWAKITIQRRATAVDAIGQPTDTWEDVCTTYADPRNQRGLEALRSGTQVSTVKTSFRIRNRAGLNAGMRVLWLGVPYNIVAVLPQGRREVIDLACERVEN